jgi:hypothetical protein
MSERLRLNRIYRMVYDKLVTFSACSVHRLRIQSERLGMILMGESQKIIGHPGSGPVLIRQQLTDTNYTDFLR